MLPQILCASDDLQIPLHVAQFDLLPIEVKLVNPASTASQILCSLDYFEKLVKREIENLIAAQGSITDLPVGFASRVVRSIET